MRRSAPAKDRFKMVPADSVSDLEPRVLDRAHETVERPRSAEGDEMRTRFQHAERLRPERNAGHAVIPLLRHEFQSIRRVANNSINRRRFERRHEHKAIAEKNQRRSEAGAGLPLRPSGSSL